MVADGRVSFSFFFLIVVRVGAWHVDALLALFSFLRVAWVGGSVSGHVVGAGRPGASSPVEIKSVGHA